MKKGFLFVLLFLSSIILSSCSQLEEYSFSFYDYMDTFISINVSTDSQDKADEIKIDIKEIYRTYHEITNNYLPLSENSGFITNVYEINRTINEDVEIDKELYDIMLEAKRLNTLTNGYFDVSIGKMVDAWKTVILDEAYQYSEIPQNVYENIILQLESIDVVENPFVLTETAGKYYIRLTDENVKIDLGALSKGYATQVVYEYLVNRGIEYFSITAGSSSISVGKKINRKSEMFHISLANPVSTSNTYGMIYVQNKAINTSGNFEQYALYNGLRYHHVVSPKTKLPAQYYHTVTVLGNDAGVLDALSTALFSMPEDIFLAFIEQHQEDLGLEVIRFNYDESITTYLLDTVYEEY
ncbi:MAG TPA: FAD:protein FMN transferase [Acholeplasmataceae bacterium]|nr:FAD:protein FMN transferase [Acholeplasmataceae bacterium]